MLTRPLVYLRSMLTAFHNRFWHQPPIIVVKSRLSDGKPVGFPTEFARINGVIMQASETKAIRRIRESEGR